MDPLLNLCIWHVCLLSNMIKVGDEIHLVQSHLIFFGKLLN